MNLLKKLKKRKSALYASLFAVICVGTPHIVPVVAQFSQFKSMWYSIPHAVAYALALEIGIVFFALRSKMLQTIIFAIIATTLYLGYYDTYIPWLIITPFMPGIISISLPVMIVLIAHETSKKRVKQANQAPSPTIADWNMNQKPVFETRKSIIKQSNGTTKHGEGSLKPRNPKPLPDEIVEKILELKKQNKETGKPTFREIAEITNTSPATVSRINETVNEINETQS